MKENESKNVSEDLVQKNQEFKSTTIKALMGNKESKPEKDDTNKDNNVKENDNSEIKDSKTLSLSDIIDSIQNMPKEALEKEIQYIKDDIKNFNVKVGIDKSAIEIIDGLENNQNKEVIEQLLKSFTQTMNIDIDKIADLSTKQLNKIKSYCNINKVYVNSGWDEAAKQGYDVNKYAKIRSEADKLLNHALKDLPKDANQIDKFKAIYKAILLAERYDYQALNTNSPEYEKRKIRARSLEGFFIDKRSVCAGTADALKQIAEMAGFEMEYVQGDAQSRWDKKNNKGPYYHAWVKVKIGDHWYNADPTWDANGAGKPFEYFLKSDKEFNKDHSEDRNYNPTYRRDEISSRKTILKSYEARNYQKCQGPSLDEYIKPIDYSIFKERRKQIKENKEYEPTEEDYKKINNEKAPFSIDKKQTLKQKIAQLFARFKKFINRNKDNKVNKNNNTEKAVNSKQTNSKMNQYVLNKENYTLSQEQINERAKTVNTTTRTTPEKVEKIR